MEALTLNTADLCRVFGVTPMTIYLWRQGTASKHSKLPVVVGKRVGRAVLFRPSAVLTWAQKNGVEVQVDPVAILAEKEGSERPRPGPKPRLAEAV